MCIYEMEFDKENKQQEYKYMAKDMSGKYVIGFLWIDEQWYTFEESDWKFYIRYQEYKNKGICVGAESSGFKDVLVKYDTIEPYTQIAKIKYNQSNGNASSIGIFNKGNFKELFMIKPDDKIPYEKWNIQIN